MDILERGAVLVELSRMLGEAEAGEGRLTFVGGEAGIGKTSLLRRFGELVRERTPLLVGGCDALSTPRPLAPLLDVADRLPGASLRFGERKDELFRDVLASFASSPRPLLLAFEDLHWADEATLDLVRFLARRVDSCRVLLVATFRDDEVGAGHPLRLLLGDVATAPGVRRLSLAPLTAEAVRTLSRGSGLDSEALHRHTGGNPFFVTEIVAAGGERIPATVRDAVLSRAARLPAAARAVLDAAAVIGFRSEPWLLRAVTGGDPAAVDACLQAGMLVSHEDGFAFRHELAREAVLGSIAPHRRVALHACALQSLRAAPSGMHESARLAHHAEEAGDVPGVLEHAPPAARSAAAFGAHRQAAAQYARALRHAGGLSGPARAELYVGYAQECAIVDDYEAAIGAIQEVARIARASGDRGLEGAALANLASCLVSVGRNAEAERASRSPRSPGRCTRPRPTPCRARSARRSLAASSS
jgi:predicted ATPase